jgi:hypothetical protein
MMNFHPRVLLVVALFAVLLMVAVDLRLGIAAVVAWAGIDAFSILPMLGPHGWRRCKRSTPVIAKP